MSKFSGGRKSASRRPAVPEEPTAHCSTSHFQPDATYADCDDTSRFMPGSLAGMSPSSRGHTMKECEEQLSQLHKENFNLKLRIYFLEERLGHRGPAAPPGTEAATTEATLRAEAESLRAELADKQRLLVQAATAIDLVEKRHREEMEGVKAEREELQGRLEQLHKMYSERYQQLEDEVARASAPQGGQPVETTSVGTQCAVDRAGAADRVDELSRQLEARGQQVVEAEQRIKRLEEALCEKQPEIQIKVQELRERDSIIEEKQNQIEQQNRVLVEIQITLAEKQRLIDALTATIAARDASIARLGAELEAARAGAADDARELGRARGENEMLKTQLGRRMASRRGESPRRRGGGGGRSRESVSPRNKSLIEEAIEGIWSAPVLRTKDEFLPFEEKENLWKLIDSKEKPDRPQPIVDHERKLSDRFSEENYLRLETEHRRGCEAIQGFVARIKHLANENDAVRRESRRTEKKLSELRLELKEMRDSYNRAKWEARQLQADATGLPGSLADVRDMTEEENERLWAEVEDKNKKLAQLSLEMEKQIQALLASLKEKEAQLTVCETKLATSEGDLIAREKYVRELEEKLSQMQSPQYDSLTSNVVANNFATLNSQNGLSKNVIDDLGVCLRQSMLSLPEMAEAKQWKKVTVDNLQESLDRISKKGGTEIFSLEHQVEFKELQLRLFADGAGADRGVGFPTNECVPMNFVHLQQKDQFLPSGLGPKGIKDECDRLRGELRAAETTRKNATDACALLVGRLEELARFLVSLLRHPERLGDLDRQLIRQAVQRSMDLSRQLSASVSITEDNPVLSHYLDDVAVEEMPASTDLREDQPATLDECSQVIARLRAQVDALKLEIKQRDIELSCLVQEQNLVKLSSPLFDRPLSSMMFYAQAEGAKDLCDVGDSTDRARLPELSLGGGDTPTHSQPIGAGRQDALALSESETWSEPDRQISMARIGLEEGASPALRPRRSRPFPLEPEESSGSSQETAREIARTPGKQRRGEAPETRRLQARLRGLEQVNEALRTELAILHQATPIARQSSCRESSDIHVIEDTPVAVPSHLLEQIRRQREKLESSLLHNDLIRRQLEGVFLSAEERAPSLQLEAAMETEARLRVAENRARELEEKLREAEGLLVESVDQAKRLAEAERRCEETRQTIMALEGKVCALEALVQKRDTEIAAKEGLFADQRAEISRVVQEMLDLRAESERRVSEAEERLREAKSVLMHKVEDIEREIVTYEERHRDTELELKEAKGNLNEALMQKAEANKIIEAMEVEFATKVRSFEDTRRGLELRLEQADEERNDEMQRRSRKLEEAERQLEELRWAHEVEVERRVEATEADFRAASRRERDEAALAASRAALDSTRLANEKLRLEQELRSLEADASRERVESAVRLAELRRREADLEARVRDLEAVNAELRAQLERMSACRGAAFPPPTQAHHRAEGKDNGYASGRGWNPDNRPRSPDSGRSPLSSLVLQRGFGRQHSEFSDYVSEDQEYETVVTRSCSSSYWITTVTAGGGSRNAHSPDLGIESDQGRLSSLEANVGETRRPEGSNESTSAVQTFRRGRSNHNCTAIEEKNFELKRELCQTRRALEETLAQLTAANHRKQNVEKAICKQIEKTCSLLQETRGNLQPEHIMLCNDRI